MGTELNSGAHPASYPTGTGWGALSPQDKATCSWIWPLTSL